VLAPARLIRRFPNLLLLWSCLWQSISTFPRSRFALRAAFGRLPGQRPLARVPVSSPLRVPVRVLLSGRRRVRA
jgi:hypothetical protein